MTVRSILATSLKPGDVLALPMGRHATVTEARVGSKFVTFRTAEYGQSRITKYDEVLVEKPDEG